VKFIVRAGILLAVAALVLWQLLSSQGVLNAHVLPSPMAVLTRWWTYLRPMEAFDPAQMSRFNWALSGELPQDAFGSLYRVLVGFLLGTGLALPLGLAMGYSRLCHALLDPLLQILRPIPPIAYIPLAILWFGLGNPPAFFLISLGAFFPVLVNTIAGVQSVDGIYLRVARNLGAGRATAFAGGLLYSVTSPCCWLVEELRETRIGPFYVLFGPHPHKECERIAQLYAARTQGVAQFPHLPNQFSVLIDMRLQPREAAGSHQDFFGIKMVLEAFHQPRQAHFELGARGSGVHRG